MELPPRQSLFWIASYPKSGNTWLRIFLANYLLGGDTPLSINKVGMLGLADGDARHYERANEGPYDLADPTQTVSLRTKFLRQANHSGPKVALVKTHCFNSTINGTPLIPPQLSRGAVYVIRHPGDVAVSFASHYGLTLDEAIARMAEPRAVVGGSDGTALQFTSDWSSHVQSWAAGSTLKTHVVRYEDMHADPETAFGKVLIHLGLRVDPQKMTRAIEHASFKELQSQEAAEGFIENTPHQPRFFRSGKSGGWRDKLSNSQMKRLYQVHGPVMAQFGYS